MRDQTALVALGKALFWDLQVGSDGKVACATCHFHAGADHRVRNQLSNSLGTLTANRALVGSDFPFHLLVDPANALSPVLRDTTQVAGSAGVTARSFGGIIPELAADRGTDVADAVFRANGLNVRQVTGRNSPSVINAVFNFRNFWDGRARNIFSGLTPFGASDPNPNVYVNGVVGLTRATLRMDNASLASQAVGPVLSGVEMSYTGRSWAQVGRKMLVLRPLAYQRIAADDSVLSGRANPSGSGFAARTTYLDLVKEAFQPQYWNATTLTPGTEQYTQAEANFALFFGLAVQAYESTLISGDTRVDRFASGDNSALNPSELRGLLLFAGRTGCVACHAGPELTLATYGGVNGNDPLKSGAETGFFHIGVRPPADDVGLGGKDDFGVPLSATFPADASRPDSAVGRFKTPGLRNAELTGPYFHDGGQATLPQVIDFYNRGGDFPPTEANGPNVRPLALTGGERVDLLAFLKSLTDDRVRFERAPFDHPELCVADGHTSAADGNPGFPLTTADRWAGLPAVGRGGNLAPLQTFEELLAGTGADGSRAHSLADPCGIEALTARGFVSANAASFATTVLARDSIVSVFGTDFSTEADSARTNPAPSTLAGRRVEIQDSAGVTRNASLFYVSPQQINFVMPEGTAAGPASIRVTGGATAFRADVKIAEVAPGLFGFNGLAAANLVVLRNGVQTVLDVVTSDAAGNVILAPIDLGAEDQQTVLVLYGTGIRNHRDPVRAMVGSTTITADYAGAQGTFAGEDQINIPLPRSLRGAGEVSVFLQVDGANTNVVKIHIR